MRIRAVSLNKLKLQSTTVNLAIEERNFNEKKTMEK